MYDNAFPSEGVSAGASPADKSSVNLRQAPDVLSGLRARGLLKATFTRSGPFTRLGDSFETGGLRLRLPRPAGNSSALTDVVLLNTAGGVAGGDDLSYNFSAGERANVRITSQSAEKVYRADAQAAQISTSLTVAERGNLAWLPLETILFNGARLRRSLSADVAASGRLLIGEITVFGRTGSGERVVSGAFADRWRIHRGGTLIFAEDIRLEGDITARLAQPVIGHGAAAIATVLFVDPKAEAHLNGARFALRHARTEWGASAWNGMLLARFAAAQAIDIRRDVAALIKRLMKTELPRIWGC